MNPVIKFTSLACWPWNWRWLTEGTAPFLDGC